jgi:hypothetical protein
MSKTPLQLRTAFVGFLALLQLFLLPATHVLHLGCQHSHDDGEIGSSSEIEAAEGTCVSSYCCGHCSHRAAGTNTAPTGSDPFDPPHDEDSCHVCQTVFAAQIAAAAPADLTTVEPACEYLTVNSQTVYSIPRYCVLSRGPPTALLG